MKTILLVLMLLLPFTAQGATVLLQEHFDDNGISARGWYDGDCASQLCTDQTQYIGGSTGSMVCHFLSGGTKCTNFTNPIRHHFTPSNQIYVDYWIKHSDNWIGSNYTYHPHMFYFLTTEDCAENLPNNECYIGFFRDKFEFYSEENGGDPIIEMQDAVNINTNLVTSRTGTYSVTPNLYTQGNETRSTAGCNGWPDNYGLDTLTPPECYGSGSTRYNGMYWRYETGTTPIFNGATASTPGQGSSWHHIQIYFQLNTIVGGIGQANGKIQYWLDGTLVIDRQNVIMRTGTYPNMQFNNVALGPYINTNIGGSPVDQYFWIDELTIYDGIPTSTALPSAPTNLR